MFWWLRFPRWMLNGVADSCLYGKSPCARVVRAHCDHAELLHSLFVSTWLQMTRVCVSLLIGPNPVRLLASFFFPSEELLKNGMAEKSHLRETRHEYLLLWWRQKSRCRGQSSVSRFPGRRRRNDTIWKLRFQLSDVSKMTLFWFKWDQNVLNKRWMSWVQTHASVLTALCLFFLSTKALICMIRFWWVFWHDIGWMTLHSFWPRVE